MDAAQSSSVDVGRILAVAAGTGMRLEPDVARQLAQFGELFLAWNARINLGGDISRRDLVERHFLDSFAAARFVPPESRVADVGSGGGLPALPLAVARPDLRLELYEPTGKKVAFLRTAIRELGLGDRLVVHAERVELSKETAPGFDVAMSRATLAPGDWLRLGRTLIGPHGRVLVFATARSIGAGEAPQAEDAYAAGRWLQVYGPDPSRATRST